MNGKNQKQFALFFVLCFVVNFADAQIARSDVALRKYWMTKLYNVLPNKNNQTAEYEGVSDSNAHPDCKVTVSATTLKDPQFDEYWQADHLQEPRTTIAQSYVAEISKKNQNGEYRKTIGIEFGLGNEFVLSGTAASYKFIRAVGQSYDYGQPVSGTNYLAVGSLKGTPTEKSDTLRLKPGFARRAIIFGKNKDGKFTVTIEADSDGGGNSVTCALNDKRDDF